MAITDVQLAVLSASAYRTTRDQENRVFQPQGWDPIADFALAARLRAMGFGGNEWHATSDSGFEAVAYRKGNEVVIAFAGTAPFTSSLGDWIANFGLAIGNYGNQLRDAARYYVALKEALPSGTQFSFTGHSLGGGLAALMGVYFDKSAVTFDPAPFRASAISDFKNRIAADLAAAGLGPDADLGNYFVENYLGGTAAIIRGESNVRSLSVEGEVLSTGWTGPFSRIGVAQSPIDLDDSVIAATGAMDLHSIDLLTLLAHSPTFPARTADIPSLLPSLFESAYFSRDLRQDRPDLLAHFVRHEFGVPGTPYAAGDGLFTSFVNEMTVLTDSGVMQQTVLSEQGHAERALQHAMNLVLQQHYYGVRGAFDPSQTLFKAAAGGWYFDVNVATGGGKTADLLAARQMSEAIGDMYDGGASKYLSPALARFDRLHWQAGDGPFNATGAVAMMDLMLGGAAGDAFIGGDAADLLLGGPGDDILDGGSGNDTLVGGAGADVYRFTGGWGHDTIDDSDGDGRIEVDGAALPRGLKVMGQDNVWASEGGALTYVFSPQVAGGSTGTFYVLRSGGADTIAIRNYTIGQLGIVLSTTPAQFAAPVATLAGDYVKSVDSFQNYVFGPVGTGTLLPINYVPLGGGSTSPQPDVLYGSMPLLSEQFKSGYAEVIAGGGANDLIAGFSGDDLLDGGDGDDVVFGGYGQDRLIGGAGNDWLYGSGWGYMWDNRPARPDAPPPVANGVEIARGLGWVAYIDAASGFVTSVGFDARTFPGDSGNLIDAGAGNDFVAAGSGNDFVSGGDGDDALYGLAGADVLLGNAGTDYILGDGLADPLDIVVHVVAEAHGDDVIDGGDGNDTLVGQGGNDHLHGGGDDDVLWGDGTVANLSAARHGNDVLDGGSGNDRLTGQGGDDELYGGTGDDLLVGDDIASRLAGEFHGADHLDGEDGNDELQGQGGADVLFGGSGTDTLFGDDLTSHLAGEFHGDDYLDGEDGDDYLEGQGGADELFGGSGADTMYGDAVGGNVDPAFHGDDYLDGEDGADLLIGGGGDDVLFGGPGNDRLQGDDVQSSVPVAAHGRDVLDGEDGDDVLAGQGGADVLYGGDGNDVLMGDAIESEVAAAAHGDDYLDGGAGDDTLIGGAGNDVLIGGEDDDSLNGDDSVLNLQAAAHGNDTLFGSGGNDLLVGAGGGDVLDGGSGDDVLRGDGAGVADTGHGDDVLLGGAGADLLLGEGGADVLYGGPGNDAIWGDGSVSVAVGDAAGGGDLLDGGDGDDGLVGGAGNDRLSGGSGNDGLYGDGYVGANGTFAVEARFEGDDVLDGGDGDDYLDAGGGDDLLIGGPGADVLKGGAGADRYMFAVGDSGRGGLADEISDTEGANVIAFAAEVGEDSLGFASSGFGPGQWLTDRFTFGPNREEIVVGDLFTGARFDIHLADGQRTSLQRLVGTRYAGTVNVAVATPGASVGGGSAADRLEVSGGDSTVAGGCGDDTVILRGGNNRHLVFRGDGRDRLTSEGTAARPDTIVLMDSIAVSELALARDGNDLRVSIGAGMDEVRVVDYYLGGVTIQVELDGALLGTNEIAAATGVVPPATRQIDIGEVGRSVFLTGGDDVAVGKGGDDTIWAGAGNDVVDGGPGDDFIHGEAGDDVLSGGRGWDRLLGGPGADVYEFSPGDGPDVVFLEASPPPGQKDRIRMHGVSPAAVQVLRMPGSLYGSSMDYLVLSRSDGSNEVRIAYFFDPAYRAGLAEVEFDDGTRWTAAQLETLAVSIIGAANQLQGTSGNDVHFVDHPNDRVVEAENGGDDTVRTSLSYWADPNVERVELTGTLASNITGNGLSNVLVGNAAANRLNGGGGDDLLIGGGGDDVYTINFNEGADTIVEAADGGIDTLIVGWEGRLPENVENLVAGSATSGPAFADGRWLIGNALDNRIDGSVNSGFRMYIDGGAGADLMIGGRWQSVFYVDDPRDVVVTTGGYNTVYSTVSYTLADGMHELYLRGDAQFGIGNAADNILSGWSFGKTQSVTLRGGDGNDRYILGAGGLAVEGPNAGNDTAVFAYQATLFSARDYANIENLELANEARAANLLGDAADNRLTGNGSDNVIEGGAGNDVLVDWAGLEASGYRNSRPPSYPYGDQDLLLGGDGDDELRSLAGSDVLDGGAGNDRIVLGAYSNFPRIEFGIGGGNDVVEAYAIAAGQPTWVQARFGPGLTSERVRFSLVDGDLRVGFDGSSDTLSLRQYAPVSGASFGGRSLTLRFADGVEFSRPQIQLALADVDGSLSGPGDDFVQGTPQADHLAGLGGSDLMLGGAGNDLLDGGDGADLIYGGVGDDVLDGGAGDDILDGGDGDDLFVGGAGDEVFRDSAGASTYRFGAGFGRDSIEDRRDRAQSPVVDAIVFEQSISVQSVEVTQAGVSELLIRISGTSDQISVAGFDWNAGSAAGTLEEIRFFDGTIWDHAELVRRASSITGTEGADVLSAGGSGDVRMYGLGGNDSLTGGVGNDLLDGGAGSDTMSGGPGDDTYVVDASGDVVKESANEGTDHVLSSLTHTLAANVERLTLTGAAAINGTGNSLANVLIGNGAANVLNGGSGADSMSGGAGNDTYVVDNAGDVVVEHADEGIDLVHSSVSHTLGDNVENLTLTGTAGISGTGNSLDNLLTGNSGANTLVGGAGNDTLDGGAGSDIMRGGAGDDTYVVGSTGDVVVENANEGLDTVRSSVTYTLGANVENVTLTGTSAVSGTGNGLDNVLIGNSAGNTLTGGAGNDFLDGGSGSDTMRGGAGDDTYVVNVSTDVVTEYSNEGVDTVQSSVSLALASNVEHLILTGSNAINGTGNALANHLRGNGAANTLNGSGGNDVLQGAGGNDTLTDASGNNVLDGGLGADSLNGGTGREFVAGGAGSDTLKLGGGADIVAFNRGHGSDSITAPTSGAGLGESNDVVSLGGVRYADLRLARSGSDLYLKAAGTTDSLRFTGWYSASGNRTVTTLQLIVDSTADYEANAADPLVNRRVVRLNFASLVNAFNAAYGANAAVGDWAIPAATLTSAFVAGSDTQALGGALAYHYGHDGNLGALDFATASSVLGDANFASSVQTFSTSASTGQVRLLGTGPVAHESTAVAARVAPASVPGELAAVQASEDTAFAAEGSMRAPRWARELAEVWATGLDERPGISGGQYLTVESWLLAADVPVAADSSAAAPSAPLDGWDGDHATTVGAAPLDIVDLDSPAAVARRWIAANEAMAGLDARRPALLGGEPVEARPALDDLLGVNAMAMASASRSRPPRSQAAAY